MKHRASKKLVAKVYSLVKKNEVVTHSLLRAHIDGNVGFRTDGSGWWEYPDSDRLERDCIEQLQRQGKPIVSTRSHVRYETSRAARAFHANKLRARAKGLLERAHKLEKSEWPKPLERYFGSEE